MYKNGLVKNGLIKNGSKILHTKLKKQKKNKRTQNIDKKKHRKLKKTRRNKIVEKIKHYKHTNVDNPYVLVTRGCLKGIIFYLSYNKKSDTETVEPSKKDYDNQYSASNIERHHDKKHLYNSQDNINYNEKQNFIYDQQELNKLKQKVMVMYKYSNLKDIINVHDLINSNFLQWLDSISFITPCIVRMNFSFSQITSAICKPVTKNQFVNSYIDWSNLSYNNILFQPCRISLKVELKIPSSEILLERSIGINKTTSLKICQKKQNEVEGINIILSFDPIIINIDPNNFILLNQLYNIMFDFFNYTLNLLAKMEDKIAEKGIIIDTLNEENQNNFTRLNSNSESHFFYNSLEKLVTKDNIFFDYISSNSICINSSEYYNTSDNIIVKNKVNKNKKQQKLAHNINNKIKKSNVTFFLNSYKTQSKKKTINEKMVDYTWEVASHSDGHIDDVFNTDVNVDKNKTEDDVYNNYDNEYVNKDVSSSSYNNNNKYVRPNINVIKPPSNVNYIQNDKTYYYSNSNNSYDGSSDNSNSIIKNNTTLLLDSNILNILFLNIIENIRMNYDLKMDNILLQIWDSNVAHNNRCSMNFSIEYFNIHLYSLNVYEYKLKNENLNIYNYHNSFSGSYLNTSTNANLYDNHQLQGWKLGSNTDSSSSSNIGSSNATMKGGNNKKNDFLHTKNQMGNVSIEPSCYDSFNYNKNNVNRVPNKDSIGNNSADFKDAYEKYANEDNNHTNDYNNESYKNKNNFFNNNNRTNINMKQAYTEFYNVNPSFSPNNNNNNNYYALYNMNNKHISTTSTNALITTNTIDAYISNTNTIAINNMIPKDGDKKVFTSADASQTLNALKEEEIYKSTKSVKYNNLQDDINENKKKHVMTLSYKNCFVNYFKHLNYKMKKFFKALFLRKNKDYDNEITLKIKDESHELYYNNINSKYYNKILLSPSQSNDVFFKKNKKHNINHVSHVDHVDQVDHVDNKMSKSIECRIEFLFYCESFNKKENGYQTIIEPVLTEIILLKTYLNSPIHIYWYYSWLNININFNFLDNILSLCCNIIFAMITQRTRLLLGRYINDTQNKKNYNKINHENKTDKLTDGDVLFKRTNMSMQNTTLQKRNYIKIDYKDGDFTKRSSDNHNMVNMDDVVHVVNGTDNEIEDPYASMFMSNYYGFMNDEQYKDLVILTNDNILLRYKKFHVLNTVNKSLDINIFGELIIEKLFKNYLYTCQYPGDYLNQPENRYDENKTINPVNKLIHMTLFDYIKKKNVDTNHTCKLNNLLGQPIAICTIKQSGILNNDYLYLNKYTTKKNHNHGYNKEKTKKKNFLNDSNIVQKKKVHKKKKQDKCVTNTINQGINCQIVQNESNGINNKGETHNRDGTHNRGDKYNKGDTHNRGNDLAEQVFKSFHDNNTNTDNATSLSKNSTTNNTSNSSGFNKHNIKYSWRIINHNESIDLPINKNGKVDFFLIRFRLLNYVYDIPSYMLNNEKDNEDVIRLVIPERKLPAHINQQIEYDLLNRDSMEMHTDSFHISAYSRRRTNSSTSNKNRIIYPTNYYNNEKKNVNHIKNIYQVNDYNNYDYDNNNNISVSTPNNNVKYTWKPYNVPLARNQLFILFRTSNRITHEEKQECEFFISSIIAVKNNTDFPMYLFKSVPGNIKESNIFIDYFHKFNCIPSPPPTYTLKINKQVEKVLMKKISIRNSMIEKKNMINNKQNIININKVDTETSSIHVNTIINNNNNNNNKKKLYSTPYLNKNNNNYICNDIEQRLKKGMRTQNICYLYGRKFLKNVFPIMKLSNTEHYISNDIKFSTLAPLKYEKKEEKKRRHKLKAEYQKQLIKKKVKEIIKKKKLKKAKRKKISKYYSASSSLKKYVNKMDITEKGIRAVRAVKAVRTVKPENTVTAVNLAKLEKATKATLSRRKTKLNKLKSKNKITSEESFISAFHKKRTISSKYNLNSDDMTNISEDSSYDTISTLHTSSIFSSNSYKTSASLYDDCSQFNHSSWYNYDKDHAAEQALLEIYFKNQNEDIKVTNNLDIIEIESNSKKLTPIPLYWLIAENTPIWITIKNNKIFKTDLYKYLDEPSNADFLCTQDTLQDMMHYKNPFVDNNVKMFKPHLLHLKNLIFYENKLLMRDRGGHFSSNNRAEFCNNQDIPCSNDIGYGNDISYGNNISYGNDINYGNYTKHDSNNKYANIDTYYGVKNMYDNHNTNYKNDRTPNKSYIKNIINNNNLNYMNLKKVNFTSTVISVYNPNSVLHKKYSHNFFQINIEHALIINNALPKTIYLQYEIIKSNLKKYSEDSTVLLDTSTNFDSTEKSGIYKNEQEQK
ncbi:conserved protein, unknown function, partial [Hepatocystis sp. ex Piliocolobus tephrosceles]